MDDFIERHHGHKAVRYIVPEMKEILSNTYGIIVYQEQIMQLAQKLAGYTLSEADLMRRAMGKKKREEMAVHEEKFIRGAVERGLKQEKAEKIFSLMEKFSDYGFPRSHSVAYAFLAPSLCAFSVVLVLQAALQPVTASSDLAVAGSTL